MKLGTDIHVPHRMNPIDYGDPDSSSSITMRLTFEVWSQLSPQLLDGLSLNLVQIFMTPSG